MFALRLHIKIKDIFLFTDHHWFYPLSCQHLLRAMFRFVKRFFHREKWESFINSLGEFAKRKDRYKLEPNRFVYFRTCVSLISLALLLAFGVDLIKQIVDEQFSTRSYTVVEPFNNATKFGMVGMPSILVFTNILSNASFENVSVAHYFKFKLLAWGKLILLGL